MIHQTNHLYNKFQQTEKDEASDTTETETIIKRKTHMI